MAILYFFAEEPVRNDEQQDCCLIVEVHAPDWINEELVHLATEEAIEDTFGKRLTLWSANQDEASQHLQAGTRRNPRLLRILGWSSTVLVSAADSLNRACQ